MIILTSTVPPKIVHKFKINGDIFISLLIIFPLTAILSLSVLFVKKDGLLKVTGISINPKGGISLMGIF
jgi:hypothetical protein